MKGWIKASDVMPEYNKDVCVILRHCGNHKKIKALLIRVNEDDCTWRTADDHTELSFDWDVKYWMPLPEDPKD